MSKTIKMPYAEYEQMQHTIEQQKEALNQVKTAKGVILLDYDRLQYAYDGFGGAQSIHIPTIKGDILGTDFQTYQDHFENDKSRIRRVLKELNEQKETSLAMYNNYHEKLDDALDKAKPWKIFSAILCAAIIIRTLWDLISVN